MDLREKAMQAARLGNPLDTAVRLRDEHILDMVKRAIAHEEVILAFQPVLAPSKTKSPVFYESLLRVLDETGRIIPAGEFRAALAHSELGRELDCLSLDLSLKQLARHPGLRLSVNMSARAIGYRPWVDILNTALTRSPSIAKRLVLEISETSVMEMPELVMEFMADQQLRGIAFGLDEYGSGATSYRLLKEFFFDLIKLDGGFTRKIQSDTENQVLAGGINQIAQGLGIQTVATFIETREEADMMTRLGFTYLQGFALGAPTISPPWDPVRKPQHAA